MQARPSKRPWRIVPIVSIALLITGCFKSTLGEPRSPAGERQDFWLNQFFFGLIGSPELDVRNVCESGAARVGVFESAGTFAATLVTLGIYTPHIAEVACVPRGAAP